MTNLKSFGDIPSSHSTTTQQPNKAPPSDKVIDPIREEFMRRKANKRVNIPQILEKKGVKFITVSAAELHINNGDETIRYYPGVGKWEVLKVNGRTGRTLQGLLEHLCVE